MATNPKQERAEHLRFMYDKALQLLMHEGRFISERSNIFLAFNSIFFTAFAVLKTAVQTNQWMLYSGIAVAIVGFTSCFLFYFIIGRNVKAANSWRSSLAVIERDPDFWYPKDVTDYPDIDLFYHKIRLKPNDPRRQAEVKDKTDEPYPIPTAFQEVRPNLVLGIIFPFMIAGVWFLALVWSSFELIALLSRG